MRGLFTGLASEDPHSHMAKLRSVCKSCVGRPKLYMYVIGLKVFPLSLDRDAAMWFAASILFNLYMGPIASSVHGKVFPTRTS